MTRFPRPESILLIGASGALGRALAARYAAPGVHLSLWGRDSKRLDLTASACRASGADVTVRSLDLTNVAAAVECALADDAATPFDLVLFASGLGDVRGSGDLVETAELVARLGAVNFTAPAAIGAALAGRMVARRSGGLVFVGSAAAFHALPFAAAYSGSKAGLARFADALRLAVRQHGVAVTLVSPGFFDTDASGEKVSGRPFAIEPEAVADQIVRAVQRRRAHVILPWPFALLRVFDRILPASLRDRLLLSLPQP